VHGDEVGFGIEVIEFRGELHAERLGTRLGEEWIVTDHAHAKGQRTLGDLRPNPTHTKHPQGFAGEFDALKLFPVPFAGDHGGMRLRHFARQAQQHGEGEFGRRNGVARGRVHHHDPPLGGGLHIYIVHPNASTTHHAQFRCGFEHLLGYLRFGTHHHGHGVRHDREQFRFTQALG